MYGLNSNTAVPSGIPGKNFLRTKFEKCKGQQHDMYIMLIPMPTVRTKC